MKKYFILIFVAALAFACGHGKSAHDEHSEKKEHDEHGDEIIFHKEKADAIGLTLQTVAAGEFHEVIKTSGQILSAQGDEATISATASGIVSFAKNSFTDGAAVRAGEVIVNISTKNLATGDPVAQTRAAYEAAQKEFNRAEDLIKDKIISQKQYEQAKLSYETAKAAYQGFASSAGARGVSVTTPIGGFIKNRFVQQGDFVSVGQPIATVAKNKRLQLRADVSEKYFNDLNSIKTANFKTSYDNKIYNLSDLNGRLLSVGKSSSQSAGYIPVTFEFDNVGNLVAGSFAEVYILSTPRQNIITVPLQSITEEQGLYFVYVQLDEEGYKKQEVKLGADDGENIQIISGLKEGDKVVVNGVYQVKLAANSGVIPEGHSHNH